MVYIDKTAINERQEYKNDHSKITHCRDAYVK